MASASTRSLRRIACAAIILPLAAGPAVGADPPPLPATAKRLGDDAIVALYDGKTFAFQSFTFIGIATGTVTYDFTTMTDKGTYKIGPHSGTFGGAISVSEDKFCYAASGGQRCNYVYVDGADIYEVKQSGIVDSIKRVAAAASESEAESEPPP
jgi:hypothetical protein